MAEVLSSEAKFYTPLSDAQRAALSRPTPEAAIRSRPGGGGKSYKFVRSDWVVRQLNKIFGHNWSWEILETKLLPTPEDPLEVVVIGRLTVHAQAEETIVKQQYGGVQIKRSRDGQILSLASDLKSASSDALKKCATLLGLALDV